MVHTFNQYSDNQCLQSLIVTVKFLVEALKMREIWFHGC